MTRCTGQHFIFRRFHAFGNSLGGRQGISAGGEAAGLRRLSPLFSYTQQGEWRRPEEPDGRGWEAPSGRGEMVFMDGGVKPETPSSA